MLGVPIMSQHIYHELIMPVMCFHCLNSLKVQGMSELGPFSMFLIRGVLAIFYLIVIKNKKKEYIVKKKVFPSNIMHVLISPRSGEQSWCKEEKHFWVSDVTGLEYNSKKNVPP